MGWLRKYAIPYAASTLATLFAAKMLETWQVSGFAVILLEWLAENGGYYATAWACDKFAPEHDKVFQQNKESLREMIAVEAMDVTVRLSLLWLATQCPEPHRSLAAGFGTALADVIFAITLTRSHRLVEIIVCVCGTTRDNYSKFSCSPELVLKLV